MLNPSIHIGKVIQHAHVFNLQNWRGLPMNSENLPQTVMQLFALLRQRRIDYVLVGGVALLQYVKGRNTFDHGSVFIAKAAGDLRGQA